VRQSFVWGRRTKDQGPRTQEPPTGNLEPTTQLPKKLLTVARGWEASPRQRDVTDLPRESMARCPDIPRQMAGLFPIGLLSPRASGTVVVADQNNMVMPSVVPAEHGHAVHRAGQDNTVMPSIVPEARLTIDPQFIAGMWDNDAHPVSKRRTTHAPVPPYSSVSPRRGGVFPIA